MPKKNTHTNSVTRRNLLKLFGILPAVAAYPNAFAKSKITTDPFYLGVASGSPAPDGFVIWTKLSKQSLSDPRVPVSCKWEVYDGAKIVASGKVETLPELDHAIHVELSGLQANRSYSYRFRAGDFVSPQGKGRTLPSEDMTPKKLRIAYASCQRWEDGYFRAYDHMANDEPDFVVFLGDYIYEYKSRAAAEAVRTHTQKHARTLDDFRDRYALYRAEGPLQKIHSLSTWIVTWDDHEVINNYIGNLHEDGSDAKEPIRLSAYQAFYEYMPIHSSTLIGGITGLQAGMPVKLYGSFDFGRLARINLLDNRQYRTAPICDKSSAAPFCNSNQSTTRTMLGNEQETWLTSSFKEATHKKILWNLICQQTRFTPANYRSGPGKKVNSDTWDGFPENRLRIIQDIKKINLPNPLIIGGDIHQNWVSNVHLDPYNIESEVVAVEFCGTSISSKNDRPQPEAEKIRLQNPHCLLSNTEKRGYGLIDITPEHATIHLKVLDDVSNPNSGIETLAKFRVLPGEKGTSFI